MKKKEKMNEGGEHKITSSGDGSAVSGGGAKFTPEGNLRKKKWLGRKGSEKPVKSIAEMRERINKKYGGKKS